MNKLIILILIVGFYGIRLLVNILRGEKSDYLFVSFFTFLIPFGFTFYSFFNSSELLTGAFPKSISIEPFILLLPFMIGALLIKRRSVQLKISKYIFVLSALFLISFLNPLNLAKAQTFYFFLRLIVLFFSFYLLTQLYSIRVLNKGIFDGLFLCISLQFILAICFPVLGMTQVVTIFKDSEDVLFYATERGDRRSAIGIFRHPGNLGLFCCMAFAYFNSSFLVGFKKRQSLAALILTLIVIVLSFSRATWIAFTFMTILMWIVYKNEKHRLFDFRNISVVLVLSFLFLFFIISFTPLGTYFSNEDFKDMGEARFIHWIAGWEVIKQHYLFGVGINNHLKYINTELPSLLDGFYSVNPIHNIHIIVFVETGIVGFILWLIFFIKVLEKCKKIFHNSWIKQCKIFNLTLSGVLISFFIYGFFGWAGFQTEQLALFLFFVYITMLCNIKQSKIMKRLFMKKPKHYNID